MIGGIEEGEGNEIAYHSGRGISMTAVGTNGNAIRGNSIHDNQGDEIENKLGIDLAGSGPNPNDWGDIDDGANKLQNYPELIGAFEGNGGTILNGILNSAAETNFEVDVFYNLACDPSGYGEGEFYQETFTVTTDASGNASFSHLLTEDPPEEYFVTTTATDPDGNTSEFSNCVDIVPALIVNTTDDEDDGCAVGDCSLREAISVANTGVVKQVVFAIPGVGPHTITPASPLPEIGSGIVIDGLSQPGAELSGDAINGTGTGAIGSSRRFGRSGVNYHRRQPANYIGYRAAGCSRSHVDDRSHRNRPDPERPQWDCTWIGHQ